MSAAPAEPEVALPTPIAYAEEAIAAWRHGWELMLGYWLEVAAARSPADLVAAQADLCNDTASRFLALAGQVGKPAPGLPE